jgi:basic membrane lipoprotein Med (substrate-binding protein (PBP1-ABC) superfamily)/DNA-binding SARP family transcriptional activator
MDFRILGALEISAHGAVAQLGPPKQRALLAILLLHAGEIVSIDRLIDLLWGENPPRTAGHSIQIYISELRKAIETLDSRRILATRPPGYQLDADAVSIDARQFERLVEEGTRKLRSGDHDGGAQDIRAALRLWRGPALSDFTYEEFAQPYIRRFHDLHLDAIEELAAAELGAGRYGEVIPMLDSAIREDPLRERSRELLMLALYRSGRPPEALRTYQQLRTVLGEELGLDPSPPLKRLQEQILIHDPSLLPAPEVPAGTVEGRNPYKGLRPFAEEDAPDFFGRDDLVGQLVGVLRQASRLVALVGPSGSGKSSVIGAGLIPRLRAGAVPGSEKWVIAQMVPGTSPLTEVEIVVASAAGVPNGLAKLLDLEGEAGRSATALRVLPEDGRLLIVIDQFEELFTITDEQPRRRFLSAIASAVSEPRSQVTVLLALRADYYDRPLLHPEFAQVFTPGVVHALPMTPNQLEAVIVRPAERTGVAVEPALLAELVADAADRPGTLPLLEFALTELFDQRIRASLTLDGYRALGGIRGVLSRSAEALYGALTDDERKAAMQVFLRLVQLGHGTTESRRRLPLADLNELDLDPVALSSVLDAYSRRRLLSFDRDPGSGQAMVEIAHESLFREWDRLAAWIDRHRAALRRYETFTAAADEWEASGRDADYLLTGTRLAEFEAWSNEGTIRITGRQKAYLSAGLERRSAEQEAERGRVETQRRLERRARVRLLALAAVVILVISGGIAGVWAGVFTDAPHVALLHPGIGELAAQTESSFDQAVSEFGLIGEEVLYDDRVTGSADAALRELSMSGPELIIVPLGTHELSEIARDHPNVSYVVSFPLEGGLPNVSSTLFAENEGSYLAGVAAALKSKTGTIGFIGGIEDWFVWAWHAGYETGARSVDPDIEIVSTYLGSPPDFGAFSDPGAAEEEARRMYSRGADVVLHAAGDSGVGVFEAATALSTPERHLWAIGAETDQYQTVDLLSGAVHAEAWRDHILTSVLKRADVAVYEVLADFARGEFQPGPRTFDLASGGIDISYSGGYIEDIRRQLETAKDQITSGRIVVPCLPVERVATARERGYPEDLCKG